MRAGRLLQATSPALPGGAEWLPAIGAEKVPLARALVDVTVPAIRPLVIGTALMASASSIGDVVLTSLTIADGSILPILVMSTLPRSVTPMTNAIGTMLIPISIAATAAALYLTRYRGLRG